MPAFDLHALVRPNVLALKPYSSARDEFVGQADIYLDANESPYPNGYNRYPDPHQQALKGKVAALKGLSPSQIFLGNGSDEAIDLLFRAFCNPGIDSVVICSPTYGMYSVSAGINDVKVVDVPLDADFQPDVTAILAQAEATAAKLLFLCSPNNPTANCLLPDRIHALLAGFKGIVVLDEAYADFAPGRSLLPQLAQHPNLVVLQTLSKAHGLAAVRLGMAFAQPDLIAILAKIKPPYNLSGPAQHIALQALDNTTTLVQHLTEITAQRAWLEDELLKIPQVLHVYPSDANFLLVRFLQAERLFSQLQSQGIIVRDRSKQVQDALRLSIGTPQENQGLLRAISHFYSTQVHA